MIKIEVTGNSIPEVADKLLAIGASLRGNNGGLLNSAAHPVGNVHVSEDADINPAALTVVEVEVAEAAPVDPIPAPLDATSAGASASSAAADTHTAAPAALDFDTDVAPHVLAVVQKLGKPAAQEILSQFGVEKASLLDPARWPELVTALQDAV